jgi:chemotaxis protein methyltransferase CheR
MNFSRVLSLNDLLKLRDLIYRRTGIYIEDKKLDQLERKVERLLEKEGFKTFRDFFHEIRFRKNQRLMQELINAITVNETYFFRENHQFKALVEEVLPELIQKRPPNEVIRILCAPCSTGEEPYSIALTLLDEGNLIQQRDFELVGIDIDSSAIKKAKEGIYSLRSVKLVPEHLLKKYFKKIDDNHYQIDEFLRSVVEFKVMNVLDTYAMLSLGKFDVIFSRNMLIYFDERSRKMAVMNFFKILKPGGYIFLGHAENMSRITSVFRTVRLKNAIAYKKEES